MKTRIISAAVGLILFAGVIFISNPYPWVLGVILAAISSLATYELTHNTKLVESRSLTALSMVFSALLTLSFSAVLFVDFLSISAGYFLILIAYSIILHKYFDVTALFTAFTAPIILGFAFSAIYALFSVGDSYHFYFALIFAFAWGSDTFAYFAGRFFGKRKLCPAISPKKTIEGFIGGIIGSEAIAIVMYLIFSTFAKDLISPIILVILAPIFSVVGVMGDLFASLIKRKCGIKDYGNIMPGHGGVLDRFDSVLLIAPLFLIAIKSILI